MTTPSILSTPNGILYKDDSIPFAGRLRGGLDCSITSNSYARAVLNLNHYMTEGRFFWVFAYIPQAGPSNRCVMTVGKIDTWVNGAPAIIRMRTGSTQLHFRRYNGSEFLQYNLAPTGFINKLDGWVFIGINIYETQIRRHLKFFATNEYFVSTLNTQTHIHTPSFSSNTFSVDQLEPWDSELNSFGNNFYFSTGLIDENLTDEQVEGFINSETMSLPVGIKKSDLLFAHYFNKNGGTDVSDFSGNGLNMNLFGFGNTTKGNVNNAWRDAYFRTPK